MTTNLHDKMLAAIDAYFSASDGTEEEVAENLLLDVRDEINKQQSKAQPAPVQEPVAWMQSDEVHISLWKDDYHTIPLFTAPPVAQPAPVQEPVDAPKIEWVNTSSDWVVRYLQANSIFNAEQIGEMMDFAALAANKFYATPPAAQPAVPMTDEQILEIKAQFVWTLDFQFTEFARAIEAAHGITKGGAA
jgi:hypothetical protein